MNPKSYNALALASCLILRTFKNFADTLGSGIAIVGIYRHNSNTIRLIIQSYGYLKWDIKDKKIKAIQIIFKVLKDTFYLTELRYSLGLVSGRQLHGW